MFLTKRGKGNEAEGISLVVVLELSEGEGRGGERSG